MKITSATFPPHIARAYGVRAAQPAARVTKPSVVEGAEPIAKIAPVERKASTDVSKLVAQVVPGSVSFTADGTAVPKTPALPIYAHPADRNAAATGIALGSSVDVTG